MIPLLLVAALGSPRMSAFGDDGDRPSPFRAVEPILRRCASCHRGDEPTGGLNLVRREGAIEGGESGPALIPGDSAGSRIWQMVERRKMPPKSPLDREEVDAIRAWIDAGAEWTGEIVPLTGPEDERWAWRPLARPALPFSANEPNPIDRFLDVRMTAEGLKPEGPADRRSLIRRLSFDLCGLPPSPEEVAAFESDTAPDAYSRLVDRLLASPAYGERWARHWLDVARFGESHGFEYDRIRELAWPYRDYVIRSLNEDKPYPDFVREQIAGDLIEGATSGTIAATGFLVAGPMDEANKAQSNKIMQARTREEELDDMVAAVGQTFLGVTVNCARCHDHKFDPIPQEDYYRFASALAGVNHGERVALSANDLQSRQTTLARLRAEKRAAEGEILAIQRDARRRLLGQGDGARSAVPVPIARWSFDADASDDYGSLPSRLEGGAEVVNGRLKLSGKGAHLIAGPIAEDLEAKTLETWVRLSTLDQGGGAAVSLLSKERGLFDAIVYGEREAGKWIAGSDSFRRTRDLPGADQETLAGATVHMAIAYESDGTITAYRNGRPYGPAYRPEAPLQRFGAGQAEVAIGLRVRGAGNGFLEGEVDEVRLYDRALTPEEIAESHREGPGGPRLAEVVANLTSEERDRRDRAIETRDRLRREIAAIPSVPRVYAATPSGAGVTHVLARGDVEKPGKAVSAGGLSALKEPKADWRIEPDAPEGSRRLALAEWLTNRDNPLAWRVMANRVWHYHFGAGLVATPNDFGVNGDRPSHPELLDWLACELRDSGGSLKALHRKIVESEAYQRSSRFNAASSAKDSESRLLWRYPPRRLEGEAIRDAMLSVSGQLNPAMGGPSFRPFTVTVFGSNIYTLTDPVGPEFNRRTIYRIHVLSAKSPLLDALDCPDPATKTPRRGLTTTPLQALALMNDSFVIRQAGHLAERSSRESGADTAKAIERMYGLTLGRSPTPDELRRSAGLARSHGLEDVAWTLLNATEFVYVD